MATLPKLTPTQTLLLRTAARRADVQTANPANLGLHPDGGEAPRSRPRMAPSPGWTSFAWGEAQMASGSCIHAGMSRWPCSTRQTSTWSERST
jgi:hypothetical protein